MRGLAATFIVILLCVGFYQAKSEGAHQGVPQTKPAKLSEAERALVAGSRLAIIDTGMSAAYFDRHFTVMKTANQPGDRRVVWRFSINEYQATVNDVLGYYTQNGKRIDVHSVAAALHTTSEITKTISKTKAHQLMQRCIGMFVNPLVEYRASDTGVARLVLIAEAAPTAGRLRSERERERKEREARARSTKPGTGQSTDVIEGEEQGGPPIVTGTVDLQTGKCTKGQLVVSP